MEVKKSSKADLEGRRSQRFLLGLVVALACLYFALEYSYTPSGALDDEELLEEFSLESDLPPLLPPENELALAPKAEPKPAQQLVVVEDVEEPQPQQEEEVVETDMDSDMEALDDEEEAIEPPAPEDEEVVSFRVVEDLPQFPGGATELMKWLTRNLKYPRAVQESKQQGRVVAEFIVNKDGSVTDVKIISSFNSLCNQEVLRVLRMMPRWTAGIMNGEPCRTKVCIPVVFRL